ncbi:uncharacterized protein C16orf96 homolog isoform X2 [Athene cunicularia]|uniref:uncharacterized protein C16orf96 homolog isoform X2 n=1 Tax=Athene cunicularia TaxID=194338 RepID=UPI000EF6ED8D|nr:uncharacterized protein C16orf96 homolog isoform X2 [Athene cunicularia]
MNVTITLAELADMAFGTASGGSPLVRSLLRGLLEHLQPQEATAQVGEDERGLLEPTATVAGGKPSSIHQQRRPSLGRAEGQPSYRSEPPGTAEPPAPDRAGTKEWQMLQLKKRMEVTKEGMMKVIDMLQEMLTTISSLKTTVEGFQEELQVLKDNFQKAGLEEARERLVRQDEHGHLLQSILNQLAEVRQELRRSSPCRVPAGELSNQQLRPKASQELAHEAPCRLSWLLEQHKAAGTHVSCHESQLQQHTDSGTLEDMAAQLEKVPREMRHLQHGEEKLDHAVLAPLQVQLEQVWRLIQQCLCQGPCCGASRAAGFKRQLFDPMKCISCDRPLATATASHLVTIQKDSQLLQPQPASAGSSSCLAQWLLGRESEGCRRASRGPVSPARPLSTSSSLVTLCSCGHPADFVCQNREVDILGIDRVIYKGRLGSSAANRTVTMDKDFPATNPPKPHCQPSTEMCRIPKYGSHYVSPYSRAAIQRKMSILGGRWQAGTSGSRTARV